MKIKIGSYADTFCCRCGYKSRSVFAALSPCPSCGARSHRRGVWKVLAWFWVFPLHFALMEPER